MHFTIEDMIPPVPGKDLGGTWNGWRWPTFPKASADAIAEAYDEFYENEAEEGEEGPGPRGAHAWYDEGARTYHFYTPASEETEVFSADVVDGVEHWAIGADAWTWERAAEVRITVTLDVVTTVRADAIQERLDEALDNGEVQNALDPDGEWTFTEAKATTEDR